MREHFDWWEDVENDIAIKAKAIPPISTVSKLVFIPTYISYTYFRRDVLTFLTLFRA